jgi:hypothetical protein
VSAVLGHTPLIQQELLLHDRTGFGLCSTHYGQFLVEGKTVDVGYRKSIIWFSRGGVERSVLHPFAPSIEVQLPDSFPEREDLACCGDPENNRFFVVGGTDGVDLLNHGYIAKVKEGSLVFTELPVGDLPAMRLHQIIWHTEDNKLYCVGGLTGTGPTNKIYVCDPDEGEAWTEFLDPAMPARYDHGVTMFWGNVVVAGGTDGVDALNDIWVGGEGGLEEVEDISWPYPIQAGMRIFPDVAKGGYIVLTATGGAYALFHSYDLETWTYIQSLLPSFNFAAVDSMPSPVMGSHEKPLGYVHMVHLAMQEYQENVPIMAIKKGD